MKIKRIFLLALAALAVPYFALAYRVAAMGDAYEPLPADCILILGHSLDGGEPGEWLVKRLEKGLDLYHAGYADRIIVSGGQGRLDEEPVAAAMRAWLVERGVDGERVIAEEQARNTVENIAYSADLLEEFRLESVIIVTNDFHMYRSMLIASRMLEVASGAPAAVPFSLNKAAAYVKEPFSIVIAMLRTCNY